MVPIHLRWCAVCPGCKMPSSDIKRCDTSQPIVHYGFIPTIILLGMTMTEPAPHFVQLISPL